MIQEEKEKGLSSAAEEPRPEKKKSSIPQHKRSKGPSVSSKS